MSNCDVFVFGRTSTIDYRWLLKPKAPLNEVFFSRVLEFSSRELGMRKRLFVSERSCGYCVFSTFFLHPAARDERGRSIAFAVGITCPDSSAREFNYRLPTLIAEAERLEQIMSDAISAAVRVDGLIASRSLDITAITPKSDLEPSGLHAELDNPEVGGTFRTKNMSSAYAQNSPTARPPVANLATSSARSVTELLRISAELRASVETPKSMSNFDAGACGSIFEDTYTVADLPPTGQSPLAYEVRSRIPQPNTSLLDQADALLGGVGSNAAGIDVRIGSRDAQGKHSQPNQDAVDPNLNVHSESEAGRTPGRFGVLGAVLGVLSGASKRGQNPD